MNSTSPSFQAEQPDSAEPLVAADASRKPYSPATLVVLTTRATENGPITAFDGINFS